MPTEPGPANDLNREEQQHRIEKLRAEIEAITSATTASKSKAEAGTEASELKLRAQKLELEIRLLDQQLSPEARRFERIKVVAGASGLVVALATAIGLFISTYQWLSNSHVAEQVREEERLDKALLQLAETTPAQRLAAIASIQSFLGEDDLPDRRGRALGALAHQLAIEESSTVRNAIVSVFDTYQPHSKAAKELAPVLDSLRQTSVGLVDEGNLWHERRENLYVQPKPNSVESRAQSVANAIGTLLRKGGAAKDLGGTYLAHIDLSNLTLDGTSFDGAILAWSSLENGSCRKCSFAGADLSDTSFVAADLQSARFGKLAPAGGRAAGRPQHNFVEVQYYRTMDYSDGKISYLEIPDFRCADLRNSSFSGMPVFEITSDALIKDFPRTPRFDLANLEGADFRQVGIFGLRAQEGACVPLPMFGWGGVSRSAQAEFLFYTANVDPAAPEDDDCPESYAQAFAALSDAFAHTNLERANLGSVLGSQLKHVPYVPETSAPATAEDCVPRAPWWASVVDARADAP